MRLEIPLKQGFGYLGDDKTSFFVGGGDKAFFMHTNLLIHHDLLCGPDLHFSLMKPIYITYYLDLTITTK